MGKTPNVCEEQLLFFILPSLFMQFSEIIFKMSIYKLSFKMLKNSYKLQTIEM